MPHAPRPQRGHGTSFALQDMHVQGLAVRGSSYGGDYGSDRPRAPPEGWSQCPAGAAIGVTEALGKQARCAWMVDGQGQKPPPC
jgi:hypothetical protein